MSKIIGLFFMILSLPVLSFYSNKEANDCFLQKVIQNCFEAINTCNNSPQCQTQLSKYQSCSFGKEQQLQYIFNGYCFRKWKQSADLTAPLINCLINECDLEYNSAIGVEELVDCTKKTIIENYAQVFQLCGTQCLGQLNKVKDKFNTQKIDVVFQVLSENQLTQKIFNLISTKCIQNYDKNEGLQKKQTSQQNQKQQNNQL